MCIKISPGIIVSTEHHFLINLSRDNDKTVVQEISNYELCVTHSGLIFAKFINSSRTSDLFLFRVLRKSLLNVSLKKYALTFHFDFGAILWGIQKTSKI